METDEQSSQLQQLQELMNRKEDLDPELEPYYEEESALGFPCIRHPLVYSMLHAPTMNAVANTQLKAKKEAVGEALLAKRWLSYVYLHERPYRLDAFMGVCDAMSDREYWELLGNIWTDSENIWQNEDGWRIAMTSDREGREAMMNEEEWAVLNEVLDPVVEVHRGFSCDDRLEGMSWTTNSIVAKFFARRLAAPGASKYVATGKVNRPDILAFFDGRSEYEVVVLPEHVFDITTREVS